MNHHLLKFYFRFRRKPFLNKIQEVPFSALAMNSLLKRYFSLGSDPEVCNSVTLNQYFYDPIKNSYSLFLEISLKEKHVSVTHY